MNKNHKEYIKGLQEKIQEYIKNKVNDENIEIKYSDFETIIHDVNIDYKIENKSCCYCDPKAYPLEEAKKANVAVIYKSAPSEETVKENYIKIVREHNSIWRKKWSGLQVKNILATVAGYTRLERETSFKAKDMLDFSKTFVPIFPRKGIVGYQDDKEKEIDISELFSNIELEAESLRSNNDVVDAHFDFLKNKINAIRTDSENYSSFGENVAIFHVCPSCGGEKVVPCTLCTGDLETYCINCSGTGVVRVEHQLDDGTRYRENETCPTCNGTGIMNCPICGGRDKRKFGANGHLQCSTCNAEGGFVFLDKTQLKTTITPEIEALEDEGVSKKIEECKGETIKSLSSLLIPADDIKIDNQIVVEKEYEVKFTRQIPDIKFTVTVVYNGENMTYECRLIGTKVEEIDGISAMEGDIMLKKLAKGIKDSVDAVKNSTKKVFGWAKGLFASKEKVEEQENKEEKGATEK